MHKKWTRVYLVSSILLASVLFFVSCSKPQTSFITSLDEAIAASEKSKKDLVILFTGSDWNEQSKTLLDSTFTPEFIKKFSKNYVLCNIDILQNPTEGVEAIQEQNYLRAVEYEVQAMPWFVFQTAENDIYGSNGGAEDLNSVDSVLSLAKSLQETRKELVSLKKKVTKSNGIAKAEAIDAFLAKTAPNRREKYSDLIKLVPDLDPENKAKAFDGTTGLKGKYLLQSAYLDAIEQYKNENLLEAGNIFFAVVENAPLTPAQQQEALYMGAYMHAISGQVEKTVTIEQLEKAVAVNPDGEGTFQIQTILDQYKNNPDNLGF